MGNISAVERKDSGEFDIENAERILEEDHYGLTKVKERMIEYLAISKLRNGIHGQIICLAGPPELVRASIVRSIAKALNRNYVRMSWVV